MRPFDILRATVVRARHLPVAASAFRAIHERAVRIAIGRLGDLPGRLVVRAKRRVDGFEAGISDLDLVAVLPDAPDGDEAFAAASVAYERLERAGGGLPIALSLHVFTRAEFEVGLALADTFFDVARTYGPSSSSLVDFVPPPGTERAGREAARHVVAFYSARAARHAIEGRGIVARVLAAHAIAKAESVVDVARGRTLAGPSEVAARYGVLVPRRDSTLDDVVRSLRALDDCLEEPVGERVGLAEPIAMPWSRTMRPTLERWSEPLLAEGAIRSVALLADSPDAFDARLVVVLDPGHPRASHALAVLRDHRARVAAPTIDPRLSPMRVHLLTESVVERPSCLRIASIEPWLRRSALVVGRPLPTPRIGVDELARNLALGWVFACADARERAALDPSPDELARAHAVVHGWLPSVSAWLDGTAPPTPLGARELTPRLRRDRVRALERAGRELVPRLVARGRRVVDGPGVASGDR